MVLWKKVNQQLGVYLEKKAQSLTKAERKATVAKKVRGSKKGKQFVKNTKKSEFKKK